MWKVAGRHWTEGVNSEFPREQLKRERHEICSSVINASEKSEQRVTSPQLITARGKGRTNRYPDPVIHIWLASIVLLARLPRMSIIPMACLWLCSCQARVRLDPHIFHIVIKRESSQEWVWGQIIGLPMGLAARQSLKASAVRRSCKAPRSCQAWPLFPFLHLTAQIPFSTPTPELALLQQSEISRHLAPNASEALLHSLCQDNSPQAVTIGGLEAAISTCTQGMDGRAL